MQTGQSHKSTVEHYIIYRHQNSIIKLAILRVAKPKKIGITQNLHNHVCTLCHNFPTIKYSYIVCFKSRMLEHYDT